MPERWDAAFLTKREKMLAKWPIVGSDKGSPADGHKSQEDRLIRHGVRRPRSATGEYTL